MLRSTRAKNACTYTEYANCRTSRQRNMRCGKQGISRDTTRLPAILLTPGKDTALAIAPHESFYLLTIQTPSTRAIGRPLAGLEVDPVLVQQVKALLLVICPTSPTDKEDAVSMTAGSSCGRGSTDKTCRAPSGDPYCMRMARGRGKGFRCASNKSIRERATNARPKSLSLICPSGSNKKFYMFNNRC